MLTQFIRVPQRDSSSYEYVERPLAERIIIPDMVAYRVEGSIYGFESNRS